MVYAKPDVALKNFFSRITLRKPQAVIEAETEQEKLTRELNLFDLLMIGIGGTVGSGIFATAVDIARTTAGPAAVLSWTIAGVGCVLSGLSFMEMSTRVPSSGSTYAYSYFSLGEFFAAMAGWFLTLEFGVSGAGVARSWASQFALWVSSLGGELPSWLYSSEAEGESPISLLAGLMMIACVAVVAIGLQIGKHVMNGITILKIFVVLFIIIVGLVHFNADNMSDFIPDRVDGAFGTAGVMLGASRAFFGYIGYDEVCCLSGETKNPLKTMPKAVIGVIAGTCFLSVMATLALVGMVAYNDEDLGEASDFGAVFGVLGLSVARDITNAGQTLTMPVVVLISFLAQPRLAFAMAEDGILPSIFSSVTKRGVLLSGTVITGVVMTIMAIFVPFVTLWDIITLGILVSFNMTSSCVVMCRYRDNSPRLAPALWGAFVLLAFIAALLWQNLIILPTSDSENENEVKASDWILSALFTFLAFVPVVALIVKCSPKADDSTVIYKVPATPLIQTLAICANWYLFAQLTFEAMGWFALYAGCAIVTYFIYGFWNSVGNNTGWSTVLDAVATHKVSQLRSSFTSEKRDAFGGPLSSGQKFAFVNSPEATGSIATKH